ncbi:hypothetical protein HMSSN139_48270 [Paenibacillus sp. HMSSN-139]|nr:hypothetical protein HMSSN139_48270 [Paenibacillus sp. HMSSN-139]
MPGAIWVATRPHSDSLRTCMVMIALDNPTAAANSLMFIGRLANSRRMRSRTGLESASYTGNDCSVKSSFTVFPPYPKFD